MSHFASKTPLAHPTPSHPLVKAATNTLFVAVFADHAYEEPNTSTAHA